jgi:hypothetical protein
MLDIGTIKNEIKDMLIDLNYEPTQPNNSDERKEEIERIVNILSEV